MSQSRTHTEIQEMPAAIWKTKNSRI